MPLNTGRPPKPIEVKRATGNPGRRPLPKKDPFRTGEPPKPKFLTERAREIWDGEASILLAMGLLKTHHGAAFGTHCQTIADFEETHARIAAEGAVSTDRFGQGKPHPLLGQLETLRRTIFAGAIQFYGTPSAGGRIVGAIENAHQNEFAELEIVQ